MRIGINTLYLLPGKVGGSETYIKNIVKCLDRLDKENDYLIFINNECKGYFEKLGPNIKTILCPFNASSRPKRILWEQLILPFQIKKHKIDLLFSGGFTAPFVCPAKSVLMVFDMQHINQPENFSKVFLFFLRTIIYLSVKSADHILTLSNNSKNDITSHYNITPENVTATYLASDSDVFYRRDSGEVYEVREKYNIPERYLYYGAASLPHKNHKRLLNVFKVVKKDLPDVKLVLTGARDYGEGSISEHIKLLGLEDDVILLGWLSFDEVAAIYSGAELFVFPSLHEGFGMPVLEAMACGVPVASSNIEPLKEIVADGGVLFDPYDEDSIGEAILTIINNSDKKNSLIEKGSARAEFFTWENTAKSTIEVFNSFSS